MHFVSKSAESFLGTTFKFE